MPMPPQSLRQAGTERPDQGSEPERPVRAWLHARARLMPDLLSQSPPWVRGVFDHSWAPMRALSEQVRPLPPHLWNQLLGWESGYVAICTGDSHYVLGPAIIRHQRVANVAFVSVEDLAVVNERPLHVLGHLIDHHLGCGGDVEGPWLSEGGGTCGRWRQAGQRLPELFALGYAVDPIAQSSVRDYFAQSLALFCQDRQRLNVADPLIYKWLRATLWDKALWQDDQDGRKGNEH
jgi:hypothetical protein